MSERMDDSQTDRHLVLPPRLSGELRAALRPDGPLPGSVDEAILAKASAVFGRRRRLRMMIRAGLPLAAAASLLLAMGLWMRSGSGRGSASGTHGSEQGSIIALTIRKDVDRSGGVDMLDALALARKIEAGEALGIELDFNGDGIIDRLDAEWIAMASVRLGEEHLQ